MESIATYVKRFSLERILSPDLLASIRPIHHEAGEHIIRKGDPVRELLFFVEGRAKVYSQMENGSSLLVRFYSPFDILGDVELFSREEFILDVVGLSPTVCLGLGVEAIKKAADRNCRLFMHLCGRLGGKLAEFNASAAINLRYPVENRLASWLLAVCDMGEAEAGLGTDDLGELADMLGTSYRQLARVVRRFRLEGLLDPARGHIRVLDREGLGALARDLYA